MWYEFCCVNSSCNKLRSVSNISLCMSYFTAFFLYMLMVGLFIKQECCGWLSKLVLCLVVIFSSYYIPTQGHDYHGGKG
jgi:hypothetical protein